MPILTLSVDDVSHKTAAFAEVCLRSRVSISHIDPIFLEEMRAAAVLQSDRPEYDIIRNISAQLHGRHRKSIHIQVLFQITSSLLAKILGNPRYGSGEGRRHLLSREEEEAVVRHIQHCQRVHNPITVGEATKWINQELLKDGRFVSDGYLAKNHNIMRHFKRTAPRIVEQQRFEASIYSNVLPFFEVLVNAFMVTNYDPDLVINFDETGLGARETKVTTRVLYDESIGPCPQKAKPDKQEHVTLCCSVAASGKRLPPVYMLRNKTVSAEASLAGSHFDFGPYGFQYSNKGYQTTVSKLLCFRNADSILNIIMVL